MKLFNLDKKQLNQAIFIVLLIITGLLALILITGTIAGLIRSRNAEPLLRFGNASGAEFTERLQSGDVRVFSGLGRLRIPLANSGTLVLSIAFPYLSNDTAFTEELAAKTGEFRSLAIEYFASLPVEKITSFDEEEAKTEILKRYNASLRLGRIEALYFTDMIIID